MLRCEVGKGDSSKNKWEIELNLKVWQDPEFKKNLLKNPKATLEKWGKVPFGVDINQLKFIEEPKDTYLIVLKHPPKRMEELSPHSLVEIAGGYICVQTIGCMNNTQI